MFLVSDVIQKLKFVWNTAPDNQRVLNFMRNPYSAHILLTNIVHRHPILKTIVIFALRP